jgi:hemimethylated DNA binding protein
MATSALSRTLLKSLLRSARRLDRLVPAAAVVGELATFSLPAGLPAASPLSGRVTFAATVAHSFRAHRAVGAGAGLNALQDGALLALQQGNKRAAALVAEAAAAAAAPAEAPGAGAAAAAAAAAPAPAPRGDDLVFSVGQVFRHRTYGYRGVIVGWDAACRASPEWVAATGTARLPHGTAQPFYHCLVDVRDRADAQISYVAQDNIELLTPAAVLSAAPAAPTARAAVAAAAPAAADPMACLVVHPLVSKYFAEYRPRQGLYVPSASLRAEFPADDAATVPLRMLSLAATARASVSANAYAAAAARPRVPANLMMQVLAPSLVRRRDAGSLSVRMSAAAAAAGGFSSSSSDSEGSEDEAAPRSPKGRSASASA